MNLQEFAEETGRLEKYWGKQLTTDQARIWFDRLKPWSAFRMHKAVDMSIDNGEKMPILSVMLQLGANVYEAPTFLASIECSQCQRFGVIRAIKEKDKYCFRCNKCENWKNKFSAIIPEWHNSYSSDGFYLEGWDAVGGSEEGKALVESVFKHKFETRGFIEASFTEEIEGTTYDDI